MFSLMEWWERLKILMDREGVSVEELAAKTKVHAKSIYGYLNPSPGRTPVANPRGNTLAKLAAALHVSEQYLRFGSDMKPTTPLSKNIPLLNMNKLGTLKAKTDPLTTWDKVSTMAVSADTPSGCFGVNIVDESGLPDFKLGETLVCDPSAPIVPGRYVVAILQSEERAIFGVYRPLVHGDDKRFCIRPPNPAFPEVVFGAPNGAKGFVLARVIKHIRDI